MCNEYYGELVYVNDIEVDTVAGYLVSMIIGEPS